MPKLLKIALIATTFVLAEVGCQQSPESPSQTSKSSTAKNLCQAVPLAQLDKSDSPKFVRLSPTTLGVDVRHEWKPPKHYADRINSYAVGAGVSIGDVDGDDLPDIYLACQHQGGRLFKNLGEWKFKDVTSDAGLELQDFWGTGSTMVDIDNDGDLDLYLCAFAQRNRLYINQGDGQFVESASKSGIDYEGASVCGSFADYDADGDLDLYLVTNHLPLLKRIRIPLERNIIGEVVVPKPQIGQFHSQNG